MFQITQLKIYYLKTTKTNLNNLHSLLLGVHNNEVQKVPIWLKAELSWRTFILLQ